MKMMHPKLLRNFPLTGIAVKLATLSLVTLVSVASAADIFKTNNSDNLNLGSSWEGGVVPGSGDVAVWDNRVSPTTPVELGETTSWGGVRMVDPGGAVTLGQNATPITAAISSATLTYTTPPVNPLVNGDTALLGGTVPGGFAAGTRYFVVNATANTFGLATNSGGTAITATSTGTGVTVTGGSTLTLGPSGIDTSSGTQPFIFPGPVVSGAAQDWNLVSAVTVLGGLAGANNVNLIGSATLTIGGSGMSLSNLVVNSGTTVSISVGGPGIVALNGGTFNVNGAISEGLNVMAGGGTEQNTGGNRTWSGSLTGSGPLIVNASSIHTWSGNNTNYTGTITLQGSGQLRLSSVNAVSAATTYNFNAGTMTPNVANSTFQLGSLGGGAGTLNTAAGQNFSIGALGTDGDFGGIIAGPGMIFKVGTGTLTLSGANTYSGATTISNGVLQIDNTSGNGKLGTGAVTNYSRLVFNRGGSPLTVANVITGPGSITNVGAGKVALTGANNYSGPTTITAGTLAVGSASQVTSDYAVGSGATLGAVITTSGATVTENNATFGSGCSYEFDLATFGNPISSVVSNIGTINLNGNITVNVLGTNLSNGTITLLRYANRTGVGNFVLGTLPPNVNLVSFNDDVVNKRVLLTITVGVVVDNTFKWVSDAFGNWDIDNTGNQIWKVVGTGQVTNYTEGAAVLFDDTATGTTSVNITTSVNPSTLIVNNTNKTYTFGGNGGGVSGTTGLVKNGPGTLIITNGNTYGGLTEIRGGTIRIAEETGGIGGGGVTNNGTLVIDKINATNTVPNTFMLFGMINGTGNLVYLGADETNSILEVEISDAVGNPYSGGTTISNGLVRLNPNPVSNASHSGAKSTGLGTGTITFLGRSTLQLDQYGVGNNDQQGGTLAAPLNVPAGQIGTLLTAGRMTVASALTGSGTLNLGVSYIRDVISGDFSAFTGQLNVNPSPNTTGNEFQIGNAAGIPVGKVHLAAGVTMGGQAPLANNSIVPIGELVADDGTFINNVGQTPRGAIFTIGSLNTPSSIAGSIQGHSLTKVGTGTLTLSGTNNTFTGTTTVSNGVLALVTNVFGNTEISNSATVRIAAPGILDVSGRTDGTFPLGASAIQTLQGDGIIRGQLVVGALGTLTPGFPIGTLTVTNAVTLGGLTLMELDRAGTPNSDRVVAPSILAGGTLTVTNIGAALHAGDSFQLFSTAVSGSFAAVNLPTNDPVNQVSYTWTNRLAFNGTIAVLTVISPVNPNPTNITFQVSGGQITLSWPADHTGWRLQSQTNSISTGLRTNWVDVAGSTTTNQISVPINATNGTVFFRMIYP